MKHYPPHFKYLFRINLILFGVYAFVIIHYSQAITLTTIFEISIPLIAGLAWYRLGYFYKPIKFDNDYFYPPKNKEKISLASIQSIKLTERSNLKNEPYWQITSTTSANIQILPPTIEDSFARFIEAVKTANPDVDTDIFEFRLRYGFFPLASWKVSKK
jgi:hypothetical protein